MIGRFYSNDLIGFRDVHSFNRFAYANNNPYKYIDPTGKASESSYLNRPLGVSVAENLKVTSEAAVGAAKEVAIAAVTGGVIGAVAKGVRALRAARATTETVQRSMSTAELAATKETGLLRGGREGEHFVSDAVNSTSQRATQRLALPVKPEVKVTMEVPKGVFSNPSKVQPANGMPGGGMERTATGNIPVKIIKEKRMK